MGDLVTPEFGHYRRGRVANLLPATLCRFSEHLTPVERANLIDRQAFQVLRLSHQLYWSAFNLAVRMSLLPFHHPHDGASNAAKKHARSANTSAEQS